MGLLGNKALNLFLDEANLPIAVDERSDDDYRLLSSGYVELCWEYGLDKYSNSPEKFEKAGRIIRFIESIKPLTSEVLLLFFSWSCIHPPISAPCALTHDFPATLSHPVRAAVMRTCERHPYSVASWKGTRPLRRFATSG